MLLERMSLTKAYVNAAMQKNKTKKTNKRRTLAVKFELQGNK